ncbi:ABC transporter substrate-binding protein [Hoeflea prorocentri]|uniref:ABC transporter substrate-binding protein n=1 Tax=Hoeflea prorocentri TaxID=1922333 RepID=A0A9X3UJJ8_9HYPH|nr:ABC transporter substrate-binding protein [Hoeflea prorocentri]MCY6381834.1 ABC transporter substrate-binding protein [Hoeflea prorocentri]MDA5399634.1 ABC transporter substrate-binding protein [Hoeflea prorocentri]
MKISTAILLSVNVMALSAQAEDSTLRIRPFGDLKQVDPIITSDYMVRNHGYMVYDTLFAVDADMNIQPQMVDTYSVSDDALTYTFDLRDNLSFSNGDVVDSTDVVTSLKRWGERDGLGQQLMALTESLEAIDEDSFQLVLKEPWGLVLDALGKPSSNVPFIMPAEIASTPSDVGITDPTGSGPFIMKQDEWVPGSKVVYVKNPNYVPRAEPASGLAGGKVANVDRVEWHYIPDAQTALNALQAGEIDIFEEMPPDFLPLVENDPSINTMPLDTLGLQMVFRMNLSVPPFSNPKVREAIKYMVDQEVFAQAYVSDPDLYVACPSFYMCSSPYFTDASWPKPDMEKAKALIAESSYDGTPVVILHATESGPTNTFSLVAAQLMREIGLNVEPQAMDWGTLTSRRASKEEVANGGWSLFLSGPSGADAMEPSGHLSLRSNCDKAWFGWPCDAEIEEMRAEFAVETDQAKKNAIAEAIQVRALDYVPYMPAATLFLIRAASADLDGVLTTPIPVYWNISTN